MNRTRILSVCLCLTVFACLSKREVRGDEQTCFHFEKQGRLLADSPKIPAPGPYFTCLVKMDRLHGFPHDYALYFSTDHHGVKGGIWLYLCSGSPEIPANWKSYDDAIADGDFDHLANKPAANPIFIDEIQGRQTETPYVNIIDGKAYMTYHNAGAGHNQSTMLAVSTDGVNFGRINGKGDSVILDYDPSREPGDGHTGYFRWGRNPFPDVPFPYVGYSLHGGAKNFFMAMWGSNDVVHWKKLEVFSAEEGHGLNDDRILIWSQIDPNAIVPLGAGEFAAIAAGGTRSWGGKKRVTELYEIFLAGDGKTLTRNGRKILAVGSTGADDTEELAQPTSVRIGETWFLVYVGATKNASVNTVMAAQGQFQPQVKLGEVLPPAEGRKHWVQTP